MTAPQLIAAALLLPASGALLIALLGRWPNLRDVVGLVVAVLTFATVSSLFSDVVAGGRPGLELLPLFGGVDLAFEVEPLGMLFALLASGLWILTAIYGYGYMRGHGEEHQTRFFSCFSLAIAAALGIAFARNLVTLFVFYEALTFTTYPLVTHHRTPEAMRAGRTYLGILVGTSVALFLLAIIWTWDVAGTTEFRPGGILVGVSPAVMVALLACYAFGIGKAALMPFHRWLPAAMVAPTPVSALLHAVAVVKAGVFCIVKVVVYVFGARRLLELSDVTRDGVRGLLSGSGWLVVAASFTILAASVVALRQDNLKRRLAYSTISQLSYIVLGAALAAPSAIVGAGLHILTHAVGKITLFFCAGSYAVGAHCTKVSELKGIGRRMPLTSLAFLLASLSVIGLPPFAGAWSKWFLILGALEAGKGWVVVVLVLSSLLNIAYLMPVPVNAFFASSGDEKEGEASIPSVREAPWLVVIPLMITAAICFALFLFIDPWLDLLRPLGGLP